jgi:hypothetical protein
MFPEEFDTGIRAYTSLLRDRLNVQLAVINGNMEGEKTFSVVPDLNQGKDLTGRINYNFGPFDVGVSGLHRLGAHRVLLDRARAFVVVAGMDGALPAVVAGLTRAPVIGVPTSVGYGAHLGGLAPLFTMLTACAPGVAVVNIDNGFGAGYLAARINATVVSVDGEEAHAHRVL